MIKQYQNSVIAQLLEAIISQVNFNGEPISNIGDILLSILEQTPYNKEPKSVLAELFLKLKDKLEGRTFTPYDKEPKSAIAEILLSILNETEYDKEPNSRIAELLLELKAELENYVELTASGAIANFTTSVVKPLVNLTAYFMATQEAGTPTPSEPKAISGVSAVNVIHCKKNLFDINFLTSSDITISSGVASGKANKFNGIQIHIPFKSNTRYSIGFDYKCDNEQGLTGNGLYLGIRYTDNSIDYIWCLSDQNTYIRNTFVSNASKSIDYLFLSYGSGALNTFYLKDIQVEEGASATDYEPYNGNAYNILFPPYSENLPYFEGLLAGTYGYVDLGSLTWVKNSYINDGFNTSSLTDIKSGTSGVKSNIITPNYNTIKTVSATIMADKSVMVANGAPMLVIRDSNYSDATAFKNSLNGVYLIYELAEAVTPTITPEQLQTLLTAFAGTYYGGYVSQDKNGKRELTVTHEIYEFDGSLDEEWSLFNVAQGNLFRISITNKNYTITPTNTKCNQYNAVSVENRTNLTVSGTEARCDIINNDYSDMTSFRAYLQNSPVQIAYQIKTPITIELPDGEPIIAFNGVNNVYNDSGDTSVTYLALISDNITRSAKARATLKAEKQKIKEIEEQKEVKEQVVLDPIEVVKEIPTKKGG